MDKVGEVKILGTVYGLYIDYAVDNPKLQTTNAYVEPWTKKLVFEPQTKDARTVEAVSEYVAKVVRHEIVHAMLNESGLPLYSQDEPLVEWIAYQLPQLSRACKEATDLVVTHLAND